MTRIAARLLTAFFVSGSGLCRAQLGPRIGPPGHIEGDLFGTSVAAAGDVDGDGYPDILVGSGAWAVRSPEDPSLLVLSVHTGKILFAVGQGQEVDRFGNRSVCGPGDLNSDGHADFVLVAWQPKRSPPDYVVTAFSGADGGKLWECSLHRIRPIRGVSLVALPDVDGDRIPDIAVGMADPLDATHPGRVAVLSGRSGCVVAESSESLGGWRWDGSIASLGDLDGDRVTDLVIPVVVFDQSGSTGKCALDVLSGTDLHRIRRFELEHSLEVMCDGLGDIDGDGVPDLLVSGMVPGSTDNCPTFARILSGRDGTLLSEFVNRSCFAKGSDLCAIGDVDHDGRRDLLLSEYSMGGSCSGVRVLSGRDAHEIRTFAPPIDTWGAFPRYQGYVVGDAGDVDQDGYADIVLGSAVPWGDEPGCVEVFSGKTGALLRGWSRESLAKELAPRPR
jgi:hypothetical protein